MHRSVCTSFVRAWRGTDGVLASSLRLLYIVHKKGGWMVRMLSSKRFSIVVLQLWMTYVFTPHITPAIAIAVAAPAAAISTIMTTTMMPAKVWNRYGPHSTDFSDTTAATTIYWNTGVDRAA